MAMPDIKDVINPLDDRSWLLPSLGEAAEVATNVMKTPLTNLQSVMDSDVGNILSPYMDFYANPYKDLEGDWLGETDEFVTPRFPIPYGEHISAPDFLTSDAIKYGGGTLAGLGGLKVGHSLLDKLGLERMMHEAAPYTNKFLKNMNLKNLFSTGIFSSVMPNLRTQAEAAEGLTKNWGTALKRMINPMTYLSGKRLPVIPTQLRNFGILKGLSSFIGPAAAIEDAYLGQDRGILPNTSDVFIPDFLKPPQYPQGHEREGQAIHSTSDYNEIFNKPQVNVGQGFAAGQAPTYVPPRRGPGPWNDFKG